MEKIPVSVVVITKNEEANIADCLKSVPWADEIVVLDDDSTDKTVSIATQYTDKVFSRKMDIEGRHRNYAYSLAKNDWVLSLDADERASRELETELRELFKGGMKDKAYSIPIKTFIGKRWIRYSGWYPAPKVRLFDKGHFKYEEAEVHPRVFIDGSCGRLTKDIVHYSYRDFHDFFQSLNNQTTLEAKKWFKERRKIGFLKMYRKAISRFLKAYIQKQGFKDGFLGFVVSYNGGLYQFMSYVKYQEMLDNERK
ncbi:MAG: glycosyltransferase family 2 protein [Candidatus Omnitrophica bacterium]|nr:glycosyltransferase family 2 protein [Candidatus Omnitrophota bacterium]MDD5435956.1 glycosyltransferase family 2 protein [Candidatus Omnitrophota bacterium]